MESKLKNLLEKPDNVELIRDNISAILKIECINQHKLAKGRPDEADYRIGVWKEKSRPWSLTEDAENKSPFPLVNVQLREVKLDTPPGSTFGQKKYVCIFHLDCYAHGEFGEEPDDTDSTLKAVKIGRVIRNIITSEHHAYFGLRGIVRDYRITQGTIGDPRNSEQSAQSITIYRQVLIVEYYEDSPKAELGTFEEYNFVTTSPNGEVLIDITGEPGVNKDK
jgi:hypothetical protein